MELKLSELSKFYGKKKALDNFSYSFNRGLYALLGPNGAGKSTLMNILSVNLMASSGKITWNGKNILTLGKDYRKLIGLVPQAQNLYDNFTVEMILDYFSVLKGLEKSFIDKEIERVLKLVNLTDIRKKLVSSLSGGMKRRLVIASALLGSPKILILDEASTGLDPKERIRIRNILQTLKEDTIIIYATHIVSDVESLADQIILLKDGKILRTGTYNELAEQINGHVAEAKLSKEEYSTFIENKLISNVRPKADGYIVRFIDDKKNFNVYPSLEDIYIYYFGENYHEDNRI